jgi:protein TonB
MNNGPVSSILPHKAEGLDLHGGYRSRVMGALIAVLALSVGLFRAPLYPADRSFDPGFVPQETVQLEEIVQTEQMIKPPPPPRPPVPVEVPNDAILEADVFDLDATLDIEAELTFLPSPPPLPPVDESAAVEEEQEIFVVVEQMPEIVGGLERLYALTAYPDLARQAGIEGLVVEADGRGSNWSIVKSGSPLLDEAALQAVKQLTFRPGRQRSRPVRVRFNIPIRFRLENE